MVQLKPPRHAECVSLPKFWPTPQHRSSVNNRIRKLTWCELLLGVVNMSVALKKPPTDIREHTRITTHAQELGGLTSSVTAIERDIGDKGGRPSTDDASSVGLTTKPLLVANGSSHQKAYNIEGRLDQVSSQPYGHHRQTSIVNGIQHSRNTSLVTSKSSSPLSPQAVNIGHITSSNSTRDNMRASLEEKTDSPPISRRPSTSGTTMRPSASTSSAANNSHSSSSQNEISKAGQKTSTTSQGGKSSRKDKMRSQSQSRSELKTVGEYALHHLFNSVIEDYDRLFLLVANSFVTVCRAS